MVITVHIACLKQTAAAMFLNLLCVAFHNIVLLNVMFFFCIAYLVAVHLVSKAHWLVLLVLHATKSPK